MILAYKSQFHQKDLPKEGPDTPISTPGFLDFLEARARSLGREIAADFGEGFITERHLGVKSLSNLI